MVKILKLESKNIYIFLIYKKKNEENSRFQKFGGVIGIFRKLANIPKKLHRTDK